jgi:hypothetical protein
MKKRKLEEAHENEKVYEKHCNKNPLPLASILDEDNPSSIQTPISQNSSVSTSATFNTTIDPSVIQDINETLVSNGIYSILNNKWNSKPEKLKIIINEKLIRQKSEQYMKIIDELIKRAKNNEDVYDEILSLRDKIKIFRKIGLSKNGEFSYENLTFKFLRRNGYIKKLLNLKNSLINKKLSIK